MRFEQFKKLDWVLIIVVLLLVSVGLLSIYGIGKERGLDIFKRQIIYVALGLILMIVFASFDYRIFRDHNFVLLGLYLLGILSLGAVLIIGKEIRGVSSWLHFGKLGFEPIELMKLAIILVLAKYFSLRHIEVSRFRHLIISWLYIFIPLVLLLLQPELGYILIITLAWLAIVIVAGIKIRHLLIICLIGLIIFSIGWFYGLKDYQKDRIVAFLNPRSDPLGQGYHIIQSVIAVGSGKIFGRGLGQGTQSQLNFLPEQHTDFIFATIAEEWGFLGSIFILVLFGVLFFKLIKISLTSSNNFARLFAIGVATMISFEAIINIGMTMGLLPIIGIPLPFLSYGGSSMVINFITLGIIESIVIRSK